MNGSGLLAMLARGAVLGVLLCCGCLAHGDEDPERTGLLIAGQLRLDGYPMVGAAGLSSQFLVPERGVRVSREGTLDEDDPTWHRPDERCLSSDLADFPYDIYVILNHEPEVATVNLTVEALSMGVGTHPDPMIFVYQADEIPGDSLDCVAANDNGLGGRDAYVQVPLAAGSAYAVVVTSFADDRADEAFGTYILGVTRL